MNANLLVDRLGLLYEPTRYPDVKDPCLVQHAGGWHLFGTGCGRPDGLELLHATAPSPDGPWTELPPVVLLGVDHIASPAAPGVISDRGVLHLFLQHGFDVLGGDIEHLVSTDDGRHFRHADTAVVSLPDSPEAGVYDPDPALFRRIPHLAYAGMSRVGEPDLFLARSRSGRWDGPWDRLGCVLAHEDVPFHNRIGTDDYEWGLEGPQLVELPDGRALLTAVCFLDDAPPGSRQRLLLAVADDPAGPYHVLDPLVPPSTHDGWGENGHGTAVVIGDEVRLVYQERSGAGRPWRYRHARLTTTAPERVDRAA